MRTKVRNLDEISAREIPTEPKARLERLNYLEAVEGWDEVNDGSGWKSICSEIDALEKALL